MDDDYVAHIAGLFDAVGAVTVHIIKDENYRLNYRYKPVVRLYRPTSDAALMGKLDEYCEEHGVRYSLNETKDGETYQFAVDDRESIRRFLEPLLPYLISKHEEATLMLDTILPAIEDADGTFDKRTFYEMVEYADLLRGGRRYGPDSKYTQEYFADLWSDELEAAA